MGNVAEMQTVEDPTSTGRVQEPNLDVFVEITKAPRRRILNAQILRAIPSVLAKSAIQIRTKPYATRRMPSAHR